MGKRDNMRAPAEDVETGAAQGGDLPDREGDAPQASAAGVETLRMPLTEAWAGWTLS